VQAKDDLQLVYTSVDSSTSNELVFVRARVYPNLRICVHRFCLHARAAAGVSCCQCDLGVCLLVCTHALLFLCV